MFSIWLSLLIVLSVNIIIATNLRCNEDINGSFQVIENCRACVIFIAPATSPPTDITTRATTTILSRNMFISNVEPSLEELFLFDEKKRRRRRRRQNVETVIHQQCARESDGPLYGYDQTHCYCNSNQCNSNIQRCIYEVTSKRHFACYHGTNSSQSPLEIRHKCRSCHIRTDLNSMFHYECLTFGEREQNDQNHCICHRPMCNQDFSTCQRFQQAPSRSRTNLLFEILSNSTTIIPTTKLTSTTPIITSATTNISTTSTTTRASKSSSTSTTTTTTMIITTSVSTTTTTPIVTASSTIIDIEDEISTENSPTIELTTKNETTTSFIEIKHLKTVYIDMKSSGNYLSSNLILSFTLFQTFLCVFIYSM